MPGSGVWHLILWIHYLALSLWIGGIIFLSGVVAPTAHHSMASRALAGEIVSKILKRLNRIELISCSLLLTTSFSSYRFIKTSEQSLCYLILAIGAMGLLTSFYTFYLTPRMESIKETIPTIDAVSSSHASKIEFDRLHRIYVKLMSLNLVLGLFVLYGSVVVLK